MKRLVFGLLFIACCLSTFAQKDYKTSLLVEWGHGGNGVYMQSIGLLGHTEMIRNLYLDFGLKALASPKHIKNTAISQVLTGLQLKICQITDNIPLYLGTRGGYGWMFGNNKKLKGGTFEGFARIKLTKHLSCGYYFTYQGLGKVANTHINTQIHEGKIIYQFD